MRPLCLPLKTEILNGYQGKKKHREIFSKRV